MLKFSGLKKVSQYVPGLILENRLGPQCIAKSLICHHQFVRNVSSEIDKKDQPEVKDIESSDTKNEETPDKSKPEEEIQAKEPVDSMFPDDIVLPWEKEGFEESSASKQSTEKPWEVDFHLENGQNLEGGSDPEHLILGPFKRKYSPLEKLQLGQEASQHRHSKYQDDNYLDVVDFERDVKNLMIFKQDLSSGEVLKKIEEFRPRENAISVKRYNQLVKDMKSAFKLSQLRQFGEEKKVPGYTKSINKSRLLKKIIKEYWKITVSDKVMDENALNTQTRIALQNRRELFLLLSHNGYITNSWSRLGAKLSLSAENDELIVSGSPNIVSFVQVSWNELLNKVQSITLKLKKLRNFYETVLHRKLPIDRLQELSNVYFDKISEKDQLYVLSAFSKANLSLAKSALLGATEYSGTVKRMLDNGVLDNYKDQIVFKEVNDSSLPWYMLSDGPVYRAKLPRPRKSQSFLVDNIQMDTLLEELRQLKHNVDNSEQKFEFNFLEGGEKTEKEEINDKQGDDIDAIASKPTSLHTSINYKDLSEAMLHPKVEKKKNWMPNMINATLGKILFQGKSQDTNSFFLSNLPGANRMLSQLSLLDKDAHLFGAAGGIRNQFTKALQIKLVPDGFKKFSYFKELPNIELWFDVIHHKVQLDSCSAYINEYENNYEIPLPDRSNDVKFQSSCNSLLTEGEEEGLADFAITQKHLFKFLSRIPSDLLNVEEPGSVSRLINSMQSRSVAIKMDERFLTDPSGNDKKVHRNVPYLITSVNLKRSIELEYRDMPVIYECVENASGYNYNVSILSKIEEENDEMTRQKQLREFTGNVMEFIKYLDGN